MGDKIRGSFRRIGKLAHPEGVDLLQCCDGVLPISQTAQAVLRAPQTNAAVLQNRGLRSRLWSHSPLEKEPFSSSTRAGSVSLQPEPAQVEISSSARITPSATTFGAACCFTLAFAAAFAFETGGLERPALPAGGLERPARGFGIFTLTFVAGGAGRELVVS